MKSTKVILNNLAHLRNNMDLTTNDFLPLLDTTMKLAQTLKDTRLPEPSFIESPAVQSKVKFQDTPNELLIRLIEQQNQLCEVVLKTRQEMKDLVNLIQDIGLQNNSQMQAEDFLRQNEQLKQPIIKEPFIKVQAPEHRELSMKQLKQKIQTTPYQQIDQEVNSVQNKTPQINSVQHNSINNNSKQNKTPQNQKLTQNTPQNNTSSKQQKTTTPQNPNYNSNQNQTNQEQQNKFQPQLSPTFEYPLLFSDVEKQQQFQRDYKNLVNVNQIKYFEDKFVKSLDKQAELGEYLRNRMRAEAGGFK
ncbi:Hypothetical_protein [Hexamita inflata]|uniref:Hypothetical_protein n=1 Tax=Hexamita inflata TaxID=28002 RepID=A0AA86UZE5_9EUKA|nr:Hypothetical protein HINF_LOCUS41073 [Hexamita inflata]